MKRLIVIFLLLNLASCSADSSEYYKKAVKECPEGSKIEYLGNGITGNVMQYYCVTKDNTRIDIKR